MNIYFEAAMQYMNLEDYDKAVENLKKAVNKEMEADNEEEATKYRCVLGELLANLDRREEARDEFAQALDYCNFSGKLDNQKIIATAFIDVIDSGDELPDFESEIRRTLNAKKGSGAAGKASGASPLVHKPIQNKAFISKQISKRK